MASGPYMGLWAGYVILPPNHRYIQVCSTRNKRRATQQVDIYLEFMRSSGIDVSNWTPRVCRNLRHQGGW